MLEFLKQKEKPPERILVLVDYENVAREASVEGKIVDFEKLATLCRNLGVVVASYIFIPHHFYDSWVEAAYNQGFHALTLPSRSDYKTVKQMYSADTAMISVGASYSDAIDQIVIVTNDGDLSTLANQARNKKKRVVLISGEKVSPILLKVVDINYPIPLQDRRK